YIKTIEYIKKIEKNKTVSTNFQTTILEMKQLLQQMNTWKSEELMADFQTAVKNNDAGRQYVLLQKWRLLNVPTAQTADKYLADETIHPVVKTLLLETIMEEKVERTINVEKFSSQMTIVPHQLTSIKDTLTYKQTGKLTQKEQQTTPSNADLMMKP